MTSTDRAQYRNQLCVLIAYGIAFVFTECTHGMHHGTAISHDKMTLGMITSSRRALLIDLFALLDGALALRCHHAAAAVHESCAMTLLSACGSWQTLLACEEPSTLTYS